MESSSEKNNAPRYCPPLHSLSGDRMLNPPPLVGSATERALSSLASEARELYLGNSVDEIQGAPPPLAFARDWLGGNRPLVMRGAVQHWPAVSKWTIPYLRAKVGDASVSVSVTPSGYADAPNDGFFVVPEERSMPFNRFLDTMEHPSTQHGVWYVQKQNSNLTTEFRPLLEDLEPPRTSGPCREAGAEVAWFSEALGRRPDAVNFWMGDHRAVTSMHKDPYENIYCVISGHKDFILVPPTDAPWVPYRKYPLARYRFTGPVDHVARFNDDPEPLHGNVAISSTDKPKCDVATSGERISLETVATSLNRDDKLLEHVPALSLHNVGKHSDSVAKSPLNNKPLDDDAMIAERKPSEMVVTTEEKKPLDTSETIEGKFNPIKTTCQKCACGFMGEIEDEIEFVAGEMKDKIQLKNGKQIFNKDTEWLDSPAPICPHFTIDPDPVPASVPWICIDPNSPDIASHPGYSRARALHVRVHAGDALYLPSLWFHHVTQSHAAVAVNYWYDMSFDIKYNYYQSLQALTWTNAEDYTEEEEEEE